MLYYFKINVEIATYCYKYCIFLYQIWNSEYGRYITALMPCGTLRVWLGFLNVFFWLIYLSMDTNCFHFFDLRCMRKQNKESINITWTCYHNPIDLHHCSIVCENNCLQSKGWTRTRFKYLKWHHQWCISCCLYGLINLIICSISPEKVIFDFGKTGI